MKKELLSSVMLTICCIILCSTVYPAIIWSVAQFVPNKGEGFVIEANGKVYYQNIGEKFTRDKYFWSRPSAVDYNAAGSGGSNKGPANTDFLKQVQDRVDTFMVHNPGEQDKDIPSELVTASGSGLDPDLTFAAINVQVRRVARARNIDVATVQNIVLKHLRRPFFGIAPQCINVLELNLDLDKITKK
jgi:K+-transporting ATPase ATPase C chain